jgi:hypothetical protein
VRLAALLLAASSLGCLGSRDRAGRDAATSAVAPAPPTVDTELASRWWRTPDGSYHLVGPARPRGQELTLDPSDKGPDWQHQAFGYRGVVTVWWNIEHNCGLEPEPRVKVIANRIVLSAVVTGQARDRCPVQVTCFKTVVSGLPAGAYEVTNPPHYRAQVAVSAAGESANR